MIDRRAFLAAPVALAACGSGEAAVLPVERPVRALKSLAPFPVGTACMTGQLSDQAWFQLVSEHFSQLTPEWEMKMEYILQDDGSLKFDAPDRIAYFARDLGLRLFGHTLIWYAQDHAWFKALTDDRARFTAEYDRYIAEVAGRWRSQIIGWDVVNEPVMKTARRCATASGARAWAGRTPTSSEPSNRRSWPRPRRCSSSTTTTSRTIR